MQQEITRLETTKQQRLQQHLISVGGMINQMTVGNSTHNISNNIYNQSAIQNNFSNNQKNQSAFLKVQRGGTSSLFINNLYIIR